MKRWILAGLAHLALLFAGLAPASADPLRVFFTGEGTALNPDVHYGISYAEADAARSAPYGLTWVSADIVGLTDPAYNILTSGVLSFGPSPPTSTENLASQSWSVQNNSGGSLEGSSYLLFTHTPRFTKQGVVIDFTDDNVGLEIDAALGWHILTVDVSGETYYYPAVELSGIAAIDAVSSPFGIHYVVKEPLIQAPVDSSVYQLPQLAVGRAFTPIPEPGTAALSALGLVLLAVHRRFAR